jgi:hypothetical protein
LAALKGILRTEKYNEKKRKNKEKKYKKKQRKSKKKKEDKKKHATTCKLFIFIIFLF